MLIYFRVLILVVACISLDYSAISVSSLHYIANALVDTFVHFSTGALCWFVIFEQPLLEILFCGILSSIIDIDHFLAAQTFSLKAALSLSHRPFFHAVIAIPLVAVFFWISSKLILYGLQDHWILKSKSLLLILQDLPGLLVVAWSSHQLRDSTRRGLWLWPFGSSPKIPYTLYIITIAGTSLITYFIILYFFPRSSYKISSSEKIEKNILDI